jgi:hypothetical protein
LIGPAPRIAPSRKHGPAGERLHLEACQAVAQKL